MRPILLPLALLAPPAAALDLALPIACTPGEDCYVQNVVDHDPGPGVRDAACGPASYDGHEGTDIALPTLADLDRGVAVLAAAPGTVAALRDGQPDALQGLPGAPDVAGVECGNGVLLTHADGWETQYCHLAQGSITVEVGDSVAAGDPLGRVGLSGQTEFPHVEFILRRGGRVVDPFAPDADLGATTCGAPLAPLWDLPFPAGGLSDAGFATAVPSFDAVRAGTADEDPSPDAPLVLFGLVHNGRAGDEVTILITGPDGGPVYDHAEALERTQALLFRAAGLEAPEGGWPRGAYAGTVTLRRDGTEIDRAEAATTLP